MVALGRNYIWPIDDIDKHLELAVSKLEAIRGIYSEEAPDFAKAIDGEIAVLKSYMKSDDAQQ
jgi:hypothetical protein